MIACSSMLTDTHNGYINVLPFFVLILCIALGDQAMMLDTYTGHMNTWQLQV